MNNRKIFRLVLVGYCLLLAVSIILTFMLDDGSLDKAWEALPDLGFFNQSVGFFTNNEIVSFIIVCVFIAVSVASIVGVFLFKNWARWLTFWLTVIIYPTSIFFGPSIFWGWEMALNDIGNVLFGAILAAMFLSPISLEFNKAITADR